MSMELNASNAGSFGELANFCCIRIDENADGTSSCWERVHNSADDSRLDVARARWIKVEPNHVRAEIDARASIIRICNTADFDLYRSHDGQGDEARMTNDELMTTSQLLYDASAERCVSGAKGVTSLSAWGIAPRIPMHRGEALKARISSARVLIPVVRSESRLQR
jgi:hypothetical protein